MGTHKYIDPPLGSQLIELMRANNYLRVTRTGMNIVVMKRDNT